MNELELLKEKANQLLSSQSGWLSCQDGSYEMALDSVGYYKLMKQISDLEKAQVDNNL
jgi:hypothetical protein